MPHHRKPSIAQLACVPSSASRRVSVAFWSFGESLRADGVKRINSTHCQAYKFKSGLAIVHQLTGPLSIEPVGFWWLVVHFEVYRLIVGAVGTSKSTDSIDSGAVFLKPRLLMMIETLRGNCLMFRVRIFLAWHPFWVNVAFGFIDLFLNV